MHPAALPWPGSSLAKRQVLGDGLLEFRIEVRRDRKVELGQTARRGFRQRRARFAPRLRRGELATLVTILRPPPAVHMPRPREAVEHAGRIRGFEPAAWLALAALAMLGCETQGVSVGTEELCVKDARLVTAEERDSDERSLDGDFG